MYTQSMTHLLKLTENLCSSSHAEHLLNITFASCANISEHVPSSIFKISGVPFFDRKLNSNLSKTRFVYLGSSPGSLRKLQRSTFEPYLCWGLCSTGRFPRSVQTSFSHSFRQRRKGPNTFWPHFLGAVL